MPMSGCALFQQPETRREALVDVADAYVGVVRTLNAARRAGEIDAETFREDINPVIQEGRSIYNDLVDAELDDDTEAAAGLRAALQGVVTRLTQYATEGE